VVVFLAFRYVTLALALGVVVNITGVLFSAGENPNFEVMPLPTTY